MSEVKGRHRFLSGLSLTLSSSKLKVMWLVLVCRSQNGGLDTTLTSYTCKSPTGRRWRPRLDKKRLCGNEQLPRFPASLVIQTPLFRLRITAGVIRSAWWRAAQMFLHANEVNVYAKLQLVIPHNAAASRTMRRGARPHKATRSLSRKEPSQNLHKAKMISCSLRLLFDWIRVQMSFEGDKSKCCYCC